MIDIKAHFDDIIAKAKASGQRAQLPTVLTQDLPIRQGATFMASSPGRVINSIKATYDTQQPEIISVSKVAASYNLVAGDLTGFLTGRQDTTMVYGLVVDFSVPQGSTIVDMAGSVTGVNSFGTAVVQTWQTGTPDMNNPNTRQGGSLLIWPTLIYNGQPTYMPFGIRPAFGAAPLPLLANILQTFSIPPSAGTVTYRLLTRGTPEIDQLVAASLGDDAQTKMLAMNAALRTGAAQLAGAGSDR